MLLERGGFTNGHELNLAPDGRPGGGMNGKLALVGTLAIIAALTASCDSQDIDLATATEQYNTVATATGVINPIETEQTVDVANMFTATPRAESPTPIPTIEATPWVDLQVHADIVERDSWSVPDAWEVGSSRATNFFAVVEKEDGTKYIIWQPYDVNPDDYANATMYWVQNGIGIGINSGTVGIDGSSANGVREILNRYYSDGSDVDGIILGDLNGNRYGSGDYSNRGGFMIGIVSESLEPVMKSVDNIGVVILFKTSERQAYIIDNNSSLPEGFLENKTDWLYYVIPFATDSDNIFDIYNGFSEMNNNILGRFDVNEGEFAFVLESDKWEIQNLVDLDDLGNE